MRLSTLALEYAEHQRRLKKLAPDTTLKNYLCLIQEFVRWIEQHREEETGESKYASVSDMTQVTFLRYIDHVSARTPKRALSIRAAIRSFCKYLIKLKWIEADITVGVEMPDVEISRRVGPSEDTITLLLRAVETMDVTANKREVYRAVLYLLVFLGLRRKEVAELRVQDIDEDARQVFIRFGKGDKSRYVKAPDEFWPIIRRYLAQRPAFPDDRLLCYSVHMGVGRESIPAILAKIIEAAGITDQHITPHCLRHAFAMRGAMNNAPMPIIALQLGHSNLATTYVYLRTPQKVNEEQSNMFGRKTEADVETPAEPVAPPVVARNASEQMSSRRRAVFRRS